MYTSESEKTAFSSFNSVEYPNLVGAMGFAIARDALFNGSISVESYNGYDIKENTVNGTHYYMNNKGLFSAYNELTDEKQREETNATFFKLNT